MKTYGLFLLTIMFSILTTWLIAQDCDAYFPMEEGAYMEMKHYNAKDKLDGTTQYLIKEKIISGNRTTAIVETKTFDKKDELVLENEIEMYCESGVFYIDMENYLNGEMMQSFEDMEVSVESNNMEMPSDLKEGMSLNDGMITMKMDMGGMGMNMTVSITNRIVESFETITTPAGTFECFKITYDIETKSIMKVVAKSAEWYAKDVGVVKSESYNKNGKLTGYTLLTEFKK